MAAKNSSQNKAIHAQGTSDGHMVARASAPVRIEYHKRNVYGNEAKYVTDPETAKKVSGLTGQKQLSDHHIDVLKSLGHEVVHVPQN